MSDKFDKIIKDLKNGKQPTISFPTNSNKEGLKTMAEGLQIIKFSRASNELTTKNNKDNS